LSFDLEISLPVTHVLGNNSLKSGRCSVFQWWTLYRQTDRQTDRWTAAF